MAQRVTPHLVFVGTAEEAMNFYVSLFAEIIGGFFYRSGDLEALSRWYEENLGVSLDSDP